MRKAILLLVFVFLATGTVYAGQLPQMQNIKSGAELVQELCQQKKYSFCSDQVIGVPTAPVTMQDVMRIKTTHVEPGQIFYREYSYNFPDQRAVTYKLGKHGACFLTSMFCQDNHSGIGVVQYSVYRVNASWYFYVYADCSNGTRYAKITCIN